MKNCQCCLCRLRLHHSCVHWSHIRQHQCMLFHFQKTHFGMNMKSCQLSLCRLRSRHSCVYFCCIRRFLGRMFHFCRNLLCIFRIFISHHYIGWNFVWKCLSFVSFLRFQVFFRYFWLVCGCTWRFVLELWMCIILHLEVPHFSAIFVSNPEYGILFRNNCGFVKSNASVCTPLVTARADVSALWQDVCDNSRTTENTSTLQDIVRVLSRRILRCWADDAFLASFLTSDWGKAKLCRSQKKAVVMFEDV